MATVRLYGNLAREFGRQFELDVRSPAEAIRALIANFPSFKKHFEPGHYHILVDDCSLAIDQVKHPTSKKKHIRIVPAIAGAKSGLLQAIAGVALIAAAVFVPGLSTIAAYAIGGLGGALAMSGLASVLSPVPVVTDASTASNRIENKYFSSAVNTEAQGRPVPIVIGEFLVGSLVVSSSTVVE